MGEAPVALFQLPLCPALPPAHTSAAGALMHRSGDKAPGFGVGQLRVAQGHYSCAYRLVGGVYAMVVSDPDANVFLCLQVRASARGAEVLGGMPQWQNWVQAGAEQEARGSAAGCPTLHRPDYLVWLRAHR